MAKKKSRNGLDIYDFEFLGASQHDDANRVYTSLKRFPTYAKHLQHVADYVFKVSLALDCLPGRVSIVAHGSTNGFWIGTDYVSLQTINRHRTALKQLGLLMIPGIARLELYSCRVGRNKALLKKISDLIGGADVIAYEDAQPATGESSGRVVRCRLKKCTTRRPRKRESREGSRKPFSN